MNPTAVKLSPRSLASIPGPQKRGTEGTLIWVGTGHRDRGHPPYFAKSGMRESRPAVLHTPWFLRGRVRGLPLFRWRCKKQVLRRSSGQAFDSTFAALLMNSGKSKCRSFDSAEKRFAPNERGRKCRISQRPYRARDRIGQSPRTALRLSWAIFPASLRDAKESRSSLDVTPAARRAAQDDRREGAGRVGVGSPRMSAAAQKTNSKANAGPSTRYRSLPDERVPVGRSWSPTHSPEKRRMDVAPREFVGDSGCSFTAITRGASWGAQDDSVTSKKQVLWLRCRTLRSG